MGIHSILAVRDTLTVFITVEVPNISTTYAFIRGRGNRAMRDANLASLTYY